MNRREVEQMGHGLFRLHWKDGGCSLAAVGSDEWGHRWYAATNWTSGPSFDWTKVERVTPVLLERDKDRVPDRVEKYDDETGP
jgi:hypothetical protein